MTYYDLLNEFYDLLQSNHVSGNAQLLYYTLLQINNRSGWTKWFQRTNQVLSSQMNIGEKALTNAKNELKQLGLIDFISSKKRGDCTKYMILNPSKEVTKEVQTQYKGSTNEVQRADIKKEKEKDIDKDKDTGGINTSLGAKAPSAALPEIPHEQIEAMYNTICISFKQVKTLTAKRKQAIGARYREHDMNLDKFKELFESVQASNFLKGENTRGWTADFDWIMKPDNFVKVMEGKYENKQQEFKETNYPKQPSISNNNVKSFAELASEIEMEGLL